MGNLLGRATNVQTNKTLDEYTKEELISYIKLMKPKNINLSEDAAEKMKKIEIQNEKIIPMAIEMYTKMIDALGEHKPVATEKRAFTKKMYYVKPKISIEEITKILETIVVEDIMKLEENLLQIDIPGILMKSGEITTEEYNESFNNVLSKKDMMGISKRVLKEMPIYLKIRFINVFNRIILNPVEIKESSIARGTYIYKIAKQGPTNDLSSFRQVLAIPNIINQMHRILNIRLSDYMLQNKYIDTDIQKGGIAGQKFSIFEQVYKLKNVLKDANKNSKSCAIVYLDITNAFGNLNLENLYKILELYHVEKSFINYLRTFYQYLEYYIDTTKEKSNPIKWKNGLVQGCAMSPMLFVIALNYILTHIDKTYKNECGYEISANNKILLTAYVDDITIVCKDVLSAQKILCELERLCKIIGLSVCKKKSAVMIINDENELMDKDIQKVTTFKYLGEYLSSDGTPTESYIQFMTNMIRRMNIIDYKKCANTEKIQIFEEIVVPWIQRKTTIMYDMGMTNKLKIISVIKPYMEKWGVTKSLDIFCDISTIIKKSEDSVIQEIVENIDDESEQGAEKEIEIANYIFKNKKINFTYSQINDDVNFEINQIDGMTIEYNKVDNESKLDLELENK